MRVIAHLCAGVSGAVIAALISANAYAATQVVRFLHNETDPPSIAFFNDAIKQFETQNPDIKIEMEAVSTDGRLQKIFASVNAKTMPEIVKILPEERFQFAKAGYLVPLDDLIDDIGRDDYVPDLLVAVDGVHYDLPYTVGNFSVLWERDDLLKAKGLHTATNWEELEANA